MWKWYDAYTVTTCHMAFVSLFWNEYLTFFIILLKDLFFTFFLFLVVCYCYLFLYTRFKVIIRIVSLTWTFISLNLIEAILHWCQNGLGRRCMDGWCDWWDPNVGDRYRYFTDVGWHKNPYAGYNSSWCTKKKWKVCNFGCFCLSPWIIIQCSFLNCKRCWLNYIYYFCRLQLMCYKFLLDSLISDGFSSRQFFDFFSLNPHSTLSEEICACTTPFGFTAKVQLWSSACFSREKKINSSKQENNTNFTSESRGQNLYRARALKYLTQAGVCFQVMVRIDFL